MRYRWPENTQFNQVVLSVEQEVCSLCQRNLHICDHRFHPILSLQGPLQLVCKLAHCPDPCCAAHCRTLSPLAETQLTLPYWLIGWDVFCLLGFRRLTPHSSLPPPPLPPPLVHPPASGRVARQLPHPPV